MGRPREFDMDSALSGAMDIFWRQGYAATNLPDLLVAMGLSRGSFYKAFGDKESVYLAALDRYDTDIVTTAIDMLATTDATNAYDSLALLFAPPKDPTYGCFICNALTELAPTHAQVAAKSQGMMDRMRNAVADVLIKHDAANGDVQATIGLARTAQTDFSLARSNHAKGFTLPRSRIVNLAFGTDGIAITARLRKGPCWDQSKCHDHNYPHTATLTRALVNTRLICRMVKLPVHQIMRDLFNHIWAVHDERMGHVHTQMIAHAV